MSVVLPPEWAPQSGIMLTWPHRDSDWQPWLETVEPVFVDIARQVSRFEDVLISGRDQNHCDHIRSLLNQGSVDIARVHLFAIPSDDTWARDHGPITVLDDGKPVLLDFIFNGWGNKFEAERDNQVTRNLRTAGAFDGTPIHSLDFVLEGGSVESDGHGSLLTTSRCLLSSQRNPRYDRAAVEEKLRHWLGVNRILWLEHGHLEGDDTDSHIDTLARFCDEHTIAYVACEDENDTHYTALKAMEDELKALRDVEGEPYRLVPLPWPQAKFDENGKRLPATYANFLIINQAVLVPTYNDPADVAALEALRGCFPQREIIGVDCAPLINQYGSLHCVTMQLPQGVF